jgi:flagellar biogenesis protein FliO
MGISVEVLGGTGIEEQRGIVGWIQDRLVMLRRRHGVVKREMHLLETLSLGGRRQLMLVECRTRLYLVGVGAESVETIVGITEQPFVSLGTKDEATP